MPAQGVIFSQHATSEANMADARALDALVLQAYFDAYGPDPSATAYMDVIPSPNPADPRAFYECCDDFSTLIVESLGFTVVDVDRPGAEWFPGPVMPS